MTFPPFFPQQIKELKVLIKGGNRNLPANTLQQLINSKDNYLSYD